MHSSSNGDSPRTTLAPLRRLWLLLMRWLAAFMRWLFSRGRPRKLPPGELAPTVGVADGELETILRATAIGDHPESVVWRQADSEVIVHLGRTRVRAVEGCVLVALSLECDETGVAEVVVPFAIGTEQRPAGLVAVSETKPRGPEVLIDRWGEAIIATAWKALLDTAARLAEGRETDTEGAPLRPGGLVAGHGRLGVIPQARYGFERGREP